MDFGEDDAAARAARISHAQAVKSKLSDAKTRQRGQPYIKVDEFEARLEPTLAPSASIFAQTGISPMTTCRRTEQGRGKTWGHGGSMRHAHVHAHAHAHATRTSCYTARLLPQLDRDAKYEEELEQAVYDQEMLDELEAMEEDESGQPKATKAKAGARVVVVYKEEEEDSGMSV